MPVPKAEPGQAHTTPLCSDTCRERWMEKLVPKEGDSDETYRFLGTYFSVIRAKRIVEGRKTVTTIKIGNFAKHVVDPDHVMEWGPEQVDEHGRKFRQAINNDTGIIGIDEDYAKSDACLEQVKANEPVIAIYLAGNILPVHSWEVIWRAHKEGVESLPMHVIYDPYEVAFVRIEG